MGGACSSPELTDSDKLSKTYKRARLGQNLVQQTNKVDPLTRYEIVSQLGAGSMGSVSAVRKRGSDDHHYFAMKTLRPGRLTREFIAELKNEIRTVRRLDHPNIIKFHEVYYGKNISIIMDHCSGKDLYSRMPYTELQAAAIMKQVLEALAYMHKRSYVHLDIKTENVMFTSQDPDAPVKIIDFGFAARYSPEKGPLHKQLGTFDFMAPEVFGGNYSTKADLWSAGVVAYEIISGKKPFAAMNQMGVVANIASGKYSLTGRLWMEKTKAAKDFIGSLIQRDADKRIDAIGALQHKWIGKVPKGKLKDTRSSHGIGAQIMSYGEAPTIKKLGLLMIAHKTFPEEVVKLQRHFSRFDPHNTGVITLENFEAALHELNKEYSHEDIQHIFNSMDTYNLGEVAYTEFIAAMLEKYVHLTEDRIADAFDRLDATSSGFISIEDLRLLLGKDFTEATAHEIMSQIDSGDDEKISFQVFLSVFRKKGLSLRKDLNVMPNDENVGDDER